MASVISVQEKAGAICNAVTCCDMSRMRRRYRRQRLRAASISRPLINFGLVSMHSSYIVWLDSGADGETFRSADISLDDRPVVIPTIARFLKQLLPAIWKIVVLSAEHPAFKNLLLLGSVKAVHLYKRVPARDAFDLSQHSNSA